MTTQTLEKEARCRYRSPCRGSHTPYRPETRCPSKSPGGTPQRCSIIANPPPPASIATATVSLESLIIGKGWVCGNALDIWRHLCVMRTPHDLPVSHWTVGICVSALWSRGVCTGPLEANSVSSSCNRARIKITCADLIGDILEMALLHTSSVRWVGACVGGGGYGGRHY